MVEQNFPGIPMQDNEPVFASPWQARTFALVLQCHENGLFSWSEWVEELSRHLSEFEKHSAVVDRDDYYTIWQSALEVLVARKT